MTYYEIKVEFVCLTTSIFKSLEERAITISQLKIFFNEYITKVWGSNSYTQETLKALMDAEELDKLHHTVKEYSSFCNYDIIKTLVRVHGSAEDKKELEEYHKKFASCVLHVHNNRIKCDHNNIGQNWVTFKLDYNSDHCADYTLHGRELTVMKETIRKILDVRKSQLRLVQIRPGCLTLDCMMPECATVPKLSREERKSLFKDSITFIEMTSDNEVFWV